MVAAAGDVGDEDVELLLLDCCLTGLASRSCALLMMLLADEELLRLRYFKIRK